MNNETEDTTIDTNPFRSLNANISSADFEIFCMKTLEAYAEREHLADFTIEHDKQIEAYDGVYQIDVFAEYTALGSKIKVLVECKKKDTRRVERDEASNLYDKIQSIGAHKGILISTTGFQRGTVQYAKAHGIALWQICDGFIKHITNSGHREITNKMKFQLFAEQYLPKHFMLEWDCDKDYPYNQIYPTKEMHRAAIEKAKEHYHG